MITDRKATPAENRKRLLLALSGINQALESIDEAKGRLIDAGLMPNGVEELEGMRSALQAIGSRLAIELCGVSRVRSPFPAPAAEPV
jgi:hypothetical protein